MRGCAGQKAGAVRPRLRTRAAAPARSIKSSNDHHTPRYRWADTMLRQEDFVPFGGLQLAPHPETCRVRCHRENRREPRS